NEFSELRSLQKHPSKPERVFNDLADCRWSPCLAIKRLATHSSANKPIAVRLKSGRDGPSGTSVRSSRQKAHGELLLANPNGGDLEIAAVAFFASAPIRGRKLGDGNRASR